MEPEGRIFSEKEAGAILKRAAELSGAAGPGPCGASLAEMERIAAEIGISPEHVRTAAAELSEARGSRPGGVVDLERVVRGELSDEAWETIVGELRRTFGDPGTVSQVGSAREWVLRQDGQSVNASVVSRHGRTRIQLLANHTSGVLPAWILWGTLSFLGLIIGAAGGAGAGGPDQALFNALIAGAASGTTYLGIRLAAGRWYQGQRRKLSGLLDRLSGRIIAEVPASEEPLALPAAEAEPVEQRLGRFSNRT